MVKRSLAEYYIRGKFSLINRDLAHIIHSDSHKAPLRTINTKFLVQINKYIQKKGRKKVRILFLS